MSKVLKQLIELQNEKIETQENLLKLEQSVFKMVCTTSGGTGFTPRFIGVAEPDSRGNHPNMFIDLNRFEYESILRFLIDSNKHRLSACIKRINELENNNFSNIQKPIINYNIKKYKWL